MRTKASYSLVLAILFALVSNVSANIDCPDCKNRQCPVQNHGWNDRAPDKDADPLAKAIKELESSEGVRVVKTKTHLEVYPRSGKDTLPLTVVPATGEGIAGAKRDLAQFKQRKVEAVEKRFMVEVPRGKTRVCKQYSADYSEKGDWIEAREPRVDEVIGLEAALERANPSNWEQGPAGVAGKGICIVFLSKPYAVGESSVLARYVDDYDGNRPALIFNPDGSARMKVILERDHEFKPKAPLGHSYSSVESLILHELAHHHQLRIGWWTEREKDLIKAMGWRLVTKNDSRRWLIRGTLPESTTEVWYKRTIDGWVACNRKGKPIPDVDVDPLSTAEMRQQAKVKPMTYYFPSATEEYAEAVMIYRLGDQYRTSLRTESPVLYNLVKREDQREIDLTYGCDREKTNAGDTKEISRFIRSPSGHLVPNTADNRQSVSRFEKLK